ncbi:unnamed protein product, partial [Ectocarpus fasciculatus]
MINRKREGHTAHTHFDGVQYRTISAVRHLSTTCVPGETQTWHTSTYVLVVLSPTTRRHTTSTPLPANNMRAHLVFPRESEKQIGPDCLPTRGKSWTHSSSTYICVQFEALYNKYFYTWKEDGVGAAATARQSSRDRKHTRLAVCLRRALTVFLHPKTTCAYRYYLTPDESISRCLSSSDSSSSNQAMAGSQRSNRPAEYFGSNTHTHKSLLPNQLNHQSVRPQPAPACNHTTLPGVTTTAAAAHQRPPFSRRLRPTTVLWAAAASRGQTNKSFFLHFFAASAAAFAALPPQSTHSGSFWAL